MSLAASDISTSIPQPLPQVRQKVVFVISSLRGGGAERVVVNWINYWKDQHDVYLILFEKLDQYGDFLGIPAERIICLAKKNRWDIAGLMGRLRKSIRGIQPDFVISFLMYTNILAVASTRWMKRSFQLIINERIYPPTYFADMSWGSLRKFFLKWSYGQADRVLSNSKMTRDALVKNYGVPSSKTAVIYNPIDLDLVNRLKEESVMHPFFDMKDAKVILAIGRLRRQKRFDILLEAVAAAVEKNLYVIILGEGPLENDLKTLVKKLDLENRVSFAGFQKNPYAWLFRADLFVLSSDYEGFPNALLEAMACGTLVISTNCPSGPSEILINGVNGMLVPTADAKALAGTISHVLFNRELKKRLVQNALETVKDYRLEKIIQQYAELLFNKENV